MNDMDNKLLAAMRQEEERLDYQMKQIRRAIALFTNNPGKEGRAALEAQPGRKRGMSPEGRARVAAAQRKRWAEQRKKR